MRSRTNNPPQASQASNELGQRRPFPLTYATSESLQGKPLTHECFRPGRSENSRILLGCCKTGWEMGDAHYAYLRLTQELPAG